MQGCFHLCAERKGIEMVLAPNETKKAVLRDKTYRTGGI